MHTQYIYRYLLQPSVYGWTRLNDRTQAKFEPSLLMRQGSYVFMDADYNRNLDSNGQPAQDFEQSLFVMSTVQSVTVRPLHLLMFLNYRGEITVLCTLSLYPWSASEVDHRDNCSQHTVFVPMECFRGGSQR